MDVTIVNDFDGDWAGIYVDGELKQQGHLHDQRAADTLDAIDVPYVERDFNLVANGLSQLPQMLSDLPTHRQLTEPGDGETAPRL